MFTERIRRARTTLLLGALSAANLAHAQTTLILTDASTPIFGGESHVNDVIAAFTNAGATVTVNTTDLSNATAMSAALVAGWDVVIVVTVTGAEIDALDVPVLQDAVDTHASGAFLFFSDACDGCTTGSTQALLSIVNDLAGLSVSLGSSDNTVYTASWSPSGLSAAFAGLPSIDSQAYAPLVGVPTANVIYQADAATEDGPMAMVVGGTDTTPCVFLTTDTTQFWVTGGYDPAQANGLAAAYLDAVCPLPATAEACIGDGVNCHPVTPVPVVIGDPAWGLPLTLAPCAHHGGGGPVVLKVRTTCCNGPTILSPVGGLPVEVLACGPILLTVPGSHDGSTGSFASGSGILPQAIPLSSSLIGVPWAAQYTVLGGGIADLSLGVSGVVGAF